ncbi:MAG TPA: FecR domain-containing protein [Vicinamibacterales bacterium]
MTDISARIEAEAVDWLIRVNEPHFADWDGFDAWLESDPRHQQSYYRLADADRAFAEDLARPANPAEPVQLQPAARAPKRSPWRWAAGIAAAITLAVTGALTLSPLRAPSRTIVETAAGAERTFKLADGSEVELNGATRISFVPTDPRRLRLESGEALFSVVHDPARPFVLETGDAVVRDVGTVFDVTRGSGNVVRVSVAEGSVSFEAGDVTRTLLLGDTIDRDGGNLLVGRVAASSVGGWRHGRLDYEDAPIARVAEDLTRSTGEVIHVEPTVAGRRFSGSIGSDGAASALVPHAADMMGVKATRQSDGWHFSARDASSS